ncbi:MAG: ABC transporter permease [Burkholderiales bacterium]|nr:ABC transporter permease [Burkholderiales bacterium]
MNERKLLGWRISLLLAFIALWQFASGRLVAPLFISSPYDVTMKLWALAVSGKLLFHASYTAMHALAGFALGALAGMAMGLALGRMTRTAEVLDPFIMGFYSLPKIALAPLFILWFGVGTQMKVLFVAVIVFLLVFLNTYAGVRSVSREQIAILRLMRASEAQILGKVVLPSAVTWVFTGLRLSVPYALIGAIMGEMMASNRGLGYLMADASAQFDTAGAFAGLVAIIVMAVLLNWAVRVAERKALPWREAEAARELSF